MKVTILKIEEFDNNALSIIALSKTEEVHLRFEDGEIEDNNMSRNFSDIFLIKDLIKIAYNAGKNGEELEIIEKETDCIYYEKQEISSNRRKCFENAD